ncbi:hypothetical protein [Paenibacillus cymbidii]|uniref:hypothetical protein n=1 Tax=Paenibacillus cymbidii TaxID=1639034 RepID=UPI001080B123|nr:hypothetical protein [Paenibacillus cymbidii]
MEALQQLKHLPLEAKANRIQALYEAVIFDESGIMYSLMKIDGEQIRPFEPKDCVGAETERFDRWRYPLQGQWELLNNENSITTSGIYLASQVYRYKATGDEAALEQAGKAFRSLELIYALGEQAGKPGWMGKPYGFRLSEQTSGDQYLDASVGLFLYHGIAPEPHRRKIETMLIAFADYWRSIDYQIIYFTSTRNYKVDRLAFNSVVLMINLMAYRFSGNEVHLREAGYFMEQSRWHHENNQDAWKNRVLHGVPIPNREETIRTFNKLLEGQLQDGEYLCWESTIHGKFVAKAAEIIAQLSPDWMKEKLEPTLVKWWSVWSLGIGDDLLPYYYFIYNAYDESWRPAPITPRLPEAERPLGKPFFSYTSQARWMEPLSRFMAVSVIAALRAPSIADDAKRLALRLMDSVDDVRIRWFYDPDGKQLIPELAYMNNVLSSEMPATYLATFWRGRYEKLW